MSDLLENIIIYEDNEDDFVFLKMLLRKIYRDENVDLNIKHYKNISDEQVIEDNDYIVLSDLGFPGTTHDEVIEFLHKTHHDRPIIILTGSTDEELGSYLISKGMQEYIPKGELKGYWLLHSMKFAIIRKSLEKEIELINHASDISSDGLIITDCHTPENEIIYASDGFLRLTGYQKHEVLGRNCSFLQGENTDPEISQKITQAFINKEPISESVLNYKKDGTPFWNLVRIEPIQIKDQDIRYLAGRIIDISNQVELEEKNKALRDNYKSFAFEVAHDIRSPLHLLKSSIFLLEDNPSEEDAKEVAGIIERSVNKLDDIISSLLRLNQLEDISPRTFSGDAILLEHINDNYKNVDNIFSLDISHDYTMDVGMFHQVIQNLIQNALKFIEHSDPKIHISDSLDKDTITLSIEDNGPGIPEAKRQQVFEALHRLHGQEVEGLGLGLNIVKKIIDKHGFEIQINHSKNLGGAQFDILMPVMV